MLRHVLAGLFILCLAAAAAPPARADACDELVAQIASATGARKVGRRNGPSIDMRTASGITLDFTCRAEPIVQASSSDPSPSAAYFRDLTTASAILIGEPEGTVQATLVQAYQIALQQRRKSFIQQRGWSASCYTDTGSALRTLCSVGRIPPN